MPKQKLFDDESEEEVEIKTENEYAKKYDQWRGKEEMHKLEQKYGSKVLDSDATISSESEDESDEPPEVSEVMETQFLKTLALLKKKDPRIYDSGFKFFDKEEKETVKPTKEKTLTFADSDDEDDDDGNIFSIEKKAEVVDEVKDTKSQGGKDGKLKEFLMGKVDHIDNNTEKDLEPLKALWSDPKLNEGEAFLRDYILNKKYLEAAPADSATDRLRDDDELGADEATVEEQDKFERAYNFRFEEPDQEYLKRYPRTMSYIRPKDERRATRRAEVRTRKEEAKARKMDEIARLKALKLQEIQQKIARIKEVTGNEELGFKDSDIEGDFDPAAHDRRMRAIFDEKYYGDVDEEKPVFPDLDKELEIENWDEYEPDQVEKEAQDFSIDEPHCEDAEFNMDADFDPTSGRANLLEEMKRSLGKKRRNRRNKSKLAALLAQDKPKYIPEEEEKSYDQYMEEYYKMDCEDVIGGDLPTRFKYREVVPNDYGLTIEEILLADDKELTQWVPLKKLVRHKPESVQRSEVHSYTQKAADKQLKKKILPSLFKNLPEEPELVISKEENKKKKKNRRKKNKQKANEDMEEKGEQSVENTNYNEAQVTENNEIVSENENVSVPEKVAKKTAKRKNKEVSQPSVNSSLELQDSIEAIDEEASSKIVHIIENDNSQTNDPSDNKNTQSKTEKQHSKIEPKADSSIESNKLTKRQKKNLKKKMKKIEEAKNATTNGESLNVAGKKRKITENNQVPFKKHKPTNNDSELKNKKPLDKGKQINHKNEGHKNKNRPADKEKQENNDKTINRDLKNNKEKFKNKNNQKTDFKKKVKQIFNKNKDNDKTDNPMNNLSDERLKAYGLNPKKYRGFLKYKKF